jgi:hypothetical protein
MAFPPSPSAGSVSRSEMYYSTLFTVNQGKDLQKQDADGTSFGDNSQKGSLCSEKSKKF